MTMPGSLRDFSTPKQSQKDAKQTNKDEEEEEEDEVVAEYWICSMNGISHFSEMEPHGK